MTIKFDKIPSEITAQKACLDAANRISYVLSTMTGDSNTIVQIGDIDISMSVSVLLEALGKQADISTTILDDLVPLAVQLEKISKGLQVKETPPAEPVAHPKPQVAVPPGFPTRAKSSKVHARGCNCDDCEDF